jgi:hypothetical protein
MLIQNGVLIERLEMRERNSNRHVAKYQQGGIEAQQKRRMQSEPQGNCRGKEESRKEGKRKQPGKGTGKDSEKMREYKIYMNRFYFTEKK